MKFEPNKKYNIYLRVDSANKNNNVINLTVTLSDNSTHNIKVDNEQFKSIVVGSVYNMQVECIANETRNKIVVTTYKDVLDMGMSKDLEAALRKFYTCAPVSLVDLKNRVDKYVKSIKSKIIKDITIDLYKKYEDKFCISPAGAKMHHAYIGGLMYHTTSMLDLCDRYVEIYPTLNRDYLISGVLLHDLLKVDEFVSPVSSDYSLEGQLLGHIVMGTVEIDKSANKFKYNDKEEVLILKHLLVSHHGQPSFGSPKKPMTKEALLLNYLDNIDSKLRVLEEEMNNVKDGEFSNNIMILERGRFYKTKNTN